MIIGAERSSGLWVFALTWCVVAEHLKISDSGDFDQQSVGTSPSRDARVLNRDTYHDASFFEWDVKLLVLCVL